MTALTSHSLCLLSQDFPWRGKIGSAALFCPFQNLTVSFGMQDGCVDMFWDADFGFGGANVMGGELPTTKVQTKPA